MMLEQLDIYIQKCKLQPKTKFYYTLYKIYSKWIIDPLANRSKCKTLNYKTFKMNHNRKSS